MSVKIEINFENLKRLMRAIQDTGMTAEEANRRLRRATGYTRTHLPVDTSRTYDDRDRNRWWEI